MKFLSLTITFLIITVSFLSAQDRPPTLSISLGVYVFPPDNKDKEAMEMDEIKCYQWAVEESGVDPLKGIDVEVETTGTEPDGSAVRGAARGAAVGAAIGAITGDAGEGAAVGSILGASGGLRQGQSRRAARKQQAEQKAAQEEQDMMESFKKAYSVCLEAKGYTVKL